jgi:GH24 family phage-related lysozyme (muramidase)
METMIPKKAIDLILEAEGVDQPWKWPGGQSGISLGFGYDLGYETHFADDWFNTLDEEDLRRLKTATGVRGHAAKVMAHRFDDIIITESQAKPVFMERTLPRYEKLMLQAFPGAENLPALVQGVLVSLVYNRGSGMKDDPDRPGMQTRLEMRNVRDVIANGKAEKRTTETLKEIARELRSMKRLWAGKGLDGLLKRREAEAVLVESAISDLRPLTSMEVAT